MSLNKSIPIRSIIFLLVLAGSLFAKTYRVPQDEPIARITMPDRWKTEAREEFLEATIANAAHLLVLPVEGRKPAESMLEAMRFIRRSGTVRVDARSEKRETSKLGDKPIQSFSWDATEKDRPLKIRFHVVSAKGKALLVAFWGSPEADKEYHGDLTQILGAVEML